MRAVWICVLGLLSGCAMTVPVAVISGNGDVMRGSSTASLSGGSFSVTGRLRGKETTCSGSYDALSSSPTISMPVLCSDGRKGIVIATRDPSGVSGSGRVRLTDGTEGDFIFGQAAASF
ncbi:hypothetical protein NPA31_007095 [Aurantimonas sp. MSK8Z-1]|uniref:hypothetical protein n=1 Tax=Mangrovibrevibacter kandeliae TaxID=2968473 RepID=UPI00211876AF|nr:hypothetical protein [Aurantimonas sp. MSK8Z-1]MCW4114727.1 hypothetical protein [Aurantimonas sp. MSK8Z-1]